MYTQTKSINLKNSASLVKPLTNINKRKRNPQLYLTLNINQLIMKQIFAVGFYI